MAWKPQWGLHQLFRTQHSSLKETECLKYICDWKYLSVRPPAFFPFKVTVIEGWHHAILTFIIRWRKRSASFWMRAGTSGRGALRCHITLFFYIFRDALINNSFNLQYVIIPPHPPLYEVTDSEEIKLSFPPQKGLNGGPRELGRNHLHEKEILFLHWWSLVRWGELGVVWGEMR